VTTPDAAPPGADAGTTFAVQQLGGDAPDGGCASAGMQSAIAVSGSKVAFASLATTPSTMTQTCVAMTGGTPQASPVPLWNVCYAESSSGGMYTTQLVTSQPYLEPTGVGLALDSKGNPTVAYTGEGTPPAAESCGSNALFTSTAQGSTFGTAVPVSQAAMGNPIVASGVATCASEQNICSSGDTTGLWPSIAFDPNDNAVIAFRDVHYGFATDDENESDVVLAEQSGGSYQLLTVDVGGGGRYNRVAFTPAGLPAVLQFNEHGLTSCVWMDRDTVGGSVAAQAADGGWAPPAQVSADQIQPQLGFGISSQGLYAAAYFDSVKSQLLYTQSMDGMTWSTPAAVDTNGATGFYPSLAFDPTGEPAIAYYRCSAQPADATSMNCNAPADGLYVARRVGTTWSIQVVRPVAGQSGAYDPDQVTDGLYPALAFVNGKIVVAYQVRSLDAVSMTNVPSWWVAEEQ